MVEMAEAIPIEGYNWEVLKISKVALQNYVHNEILAVLGYGERKVTTMDDKSYPIPSSKINSF